MHAAHALQQAQFWAILPGMSGNDVVKLWQLDGDCCLAWQVSKPHIQPKGEVIWKKKFKKKKSQVELLFVQVKQTQERRI